MWLEQWLRKQLDINETGSSSRRLVCAALARALIWPSNEKPARQGLDYSQILGCELEMTSKFLVQICRSCCGLVDSVPPSLAEEVIRKFETSANRLTRQSPILDVLVEEA